MLAFACFAAGLALDHGAAAVFVAAAVDASC